MNWSDIFYYDETSKSCLRWKKDRVRVKAGDEVGTKCFTKSKSPHSWRVKLNGKNLKIHRIIWEMFNDVIPNKLVINHIDCNPFNNRIQNLECVTNATNTQRQRVHKSKRYLSSRNKSGINGVFTFIDNNGVLCARSVVSIPNHKNRIKTIKIYDEKNKTEILCELEAWRIKTISQLTFDGILNYDKTVLGDVYEPS